ncbi:LuxR C-terminal-related transcriptional regulator [Streptomyces sp. NPDC017254]|uniref:helix-turn-helix transcriptional regulator n=1 Tax=unclassified Streptomyces TaxID=2593676 RepID=UPI0037903589
MSGAMHTVAPRRRLYDRTAELAAVDRLSARIEAGLGGVLFFTGDPGEGRTAVLSRAADDFARTGSPGASGTWPGSTGHLVGAPEHRGPWSGARALFAALAPTPSAARRALRLARGESGLAAAVAELLGGRPALICLDDLHLWDAHSRAALTAAWQDAGRQKAGRHDAGRHDGAGRHEGGRSEAGRSELSRQGRTGWVVSAARHHRLPEVPGAETVRLGRLTPDGARALLGELCAVPPAPAVAGRLLDDIAGHPGLLASVARRLTAAQLAGGAPLPRPVADGAVLAEVYGGLLGHLPADSRRLLSLVALADRTGGAGASAAYEVDIGAVLAAARATRTHVEALDGLLADGLLCRRGDLLRFEDAFLARAARASAPEAWHPCVQEATGSDPARTTGAGAGAGPTSALLTWSEEHRADRLGSFPAGRVLAPVVRGRSQLVRGLAALAGGPVMDAYESLLQAAELLRDRAPAEASDARFLAMEAAWAGGDVPACLTALDGGRDARGSERDFAEGLSAALSVRLDHARPSLARVVARDGCEDDPRLLLRAGSAALVLGDTTAAARVHARALARARAERRTSLLPRVLEHLAYAELRAGRYSRAARTAREGLRAAELTGQRNVAAHQHAVLALVASVVGDEGAVTEHAGRALETARPHGLAQAATLAEWALARSELGRGLAAQAAARLVPLVRVGPRGGHFALRMLVVPCFVEAAVAGDRRAEARAAADEYAVWAVQGVDSAAPAHLARCRALLAKGEEPAYWFDEAVRHHDNCGNDFERARTLLAYGTWLRRRRRPGDARGPLRDALVTFERAAADGWAEHARSELRATGGATGGVVSPGAWARLTPQQQRIARLVAQGATNREIADRLALSPRTVDHHLRSVFARLGIRSRVELSGVVGQWDTPG